MTSPQQPEASLRALVAELREEARTHDAELCPSFTPVIDRIEAALAVPVEAVCECKHPQFQHGELRRGECSGCLDDGPYGVRHRFQLSRKKRCDIGQEECTPYTVDGRERCNAHYGKFATEPPAPQAEMVRRCPNCNDVLEAGQDGSMCDKPATMENQDDQ